MPRLYKEYPPGLASGVVVPMGMDRQAVAAGGAQYHKVAGRDVHRLPHQQCSL